MKPVTNAIIKKLTNSDLQKLYKLGFDFDFEIRVHQRNESVTETKIRDNIFNDFNPELVNYQFEFVPTPLASGGVGMYIRDDLRYTVLEKCSNNAFQALWVEIELLNKPNIICGVIYRQHNTPESFQTYFENAMDKFSALRSNKPIYVLGDFNKALFHVSFHKLQDTRIIVIHFIAYTLSYTLS